MSRPRLLVLLTLIVAGALAVALPSLAGNNPITETNGVGAGPAYSQPGNAAIGKKLFITFCGKCHTMGAAGTHGTIGPNLDRDNPNYTNVVNAVVQGVGGIQAEYLLRVLKFQQLYDVAKFVTTQRR